jgi:hypothetical protein
VDSRRSKLAFWATLAAITAATPAIFIWWPPPKPQHGGVEATGAAKTAGTTVSKAVSAALQPRHKRLRHAKQTSTNPATRTRVKLSITASRGSSWILVRRESTKGSVLFAGTLAQGRSVVLAAPKLYAQFGVLRNLDVQVGQVTVDLSCYANHGVLLTQDGAFPKPSKSCLARLHS